MKIIIVGGPPSVGKTSIIVHSLKHIQKKRKKIGVIKLDCLVGGDEEIYEKNNIKVFLGLSVYICPDHYLGTNIDRIINYGKDEKLDYLIIESAGLCNRCSPHLNDILAVTVIDMLSGINTPKKIGPLLKSADIVILTRGDLISQAEREVFRIQVYKMNKKATILAINGLTGQNSHVLAAQFENAPSYNPDKDLHLRYSMPAAVCSFCLGEKRVGEVHARGNVKLFEIKESKNKKKREMKHV